MPVISPLYNIVHVLQNDNVSKCFPDDGAFGLPWLQYEPQVAAGSNKSWFSCFLVSQKASFSLEYETTREYASLYINILFF